MRVFSYQNKRRAKTFLIVLSIAAAVLFLFCLFRFIYLQRFLVFSDREVTLNYTQDLVMDHTQTAPAWSEDTLEIITEEPVIQTVGSSDAPLEPLSGYYITTQMLLDMDVVNAVLPRGDASPDTLMLDLKSIYGNFYYSSDTPGAMTSSADISSIDSLITQLSAEPGLYLIARVASLSDTNFALANQSCGLPLRSGALWMSAEGCYWLDPLAEPVQEYLAGIAEELAYMGFDEIVFDDFRIPDSQNIIYKTEGTREEAAAAAAAQLRERLSALPIRVSFVSSNPLVAEHSDRVFLVTQDGSAVSDLVKSVQDTVEDPSAEIVFLTPSRDTRFDGYGILRPLIEEREQ